MAYLHSHNVIHRDLKPGNVLMDEYLHPKISDFGLSKITDFLSISMNQQSQKGFKGTPIYMAPEIFINEEYSKATDVYAFSIVVYEILTLNKPYSKWSINRILYKVANEGYRPEISEDIPDCFRQLIEKCWSKMLKNNRHLKTSLLNWRRMRNSSCPSL